MDTHVLVWLVEGSPRLGSRTLERINAAFRAGEAAVSAISFWEVAMLVEKGRVRVDMDLSVWRKDLLQQGLLELPLTGDIAIKAAELKSLHGDSADRLIAATALQHSLSLLTADEKLLNCKLAVKRYDASQ